MKDGLDMAAIFQFETPPVKMVIVLTQMSDNDSLVGRAIFDKMLFEQTVNMVNELLLMCVSDIMVSLVIIVVFQHIQLDVYMDQLVQLMNVIEIQDGKEKFEILQFDHFLVIMDIVKVLKLHISQIIFLIYRT
jgi:hypothetical protein